MNWLIILAIVIAIVIAIILAIYIGLVYYVSNMHPQNYRHVSRFGHFWFGWMRKSMTPEELRAANEAVRLRILKNREIQKQRTNR